MDKIIVKIIMCMLPTWNAKFFDRSIDGKSVGHMPVIEPIPTRTYEHSPIISMTRLVTCQKRFDLFCYFWIWLTMTCSYQCRQEKPFHSEYEC